MSIQAINELLLTYIRDFNREPSEIRIGRKALDTIADKLLSAQEWRDHVAHRAGAGELFLFGIPVVLA